MYKYSTLRIDLNVESAQTKLIKLVGTNKKVLEYGCASGYVSKVLKEQFSCAVTGIEIHPDAAKEAEKYCARIIVGDIEEIDMPVVLGNERFDVITFGDILEHLKYPDRVLAAVRPFLSDDGYIVASIPNVAHISVALELLNGKFDYRPLGLLDDTHLRFFTKKSILSLFRNSGYEIVLWDRVIVKPEDTEFQTVLDSYPHSLMSFFESGSEALTYQFVVKAIPYHSGKHLIDLQKEWEDAVLQELRDKLADKEIQTREMINDKKRELEDKKRELEDKKRIYNTYSWKLTRPLRWIGRNVLGRK